ncbi:VOC family protein [Gordonia otitidis]|uniref:VOC family protein n=1 Tax=Gordonia otitidis TaxID=249058 RepID=UPI001D14EA42|nr:VOC family protein [Gordonia otitidis]UEA57945.1 VOC family protein [Gordonia otitidis]
MTLSVAMITVDALEPTTLAAWWATNLGGTIVEENDGFFVIVALGQGQPVIGFQKVDDPTPGKNRIHLDLTSPDYPAVVDTLVENGATKIGDREIPGGGFEWTTLSDPAGNEFCVSGGH